MTTPSQTLTLVAAIMLVSLMSTLVWLSLALVARIAPRASLTMAGSSLCGALSLGLHAMRSPSPGALTGWPADLLTLASFALLTTAVKAIVTRHLHWKPGATTVAVVAVVLMMMPDNGPLRWHAGLVCAVAAALVLQAGVTAWRHLRAAHGQRTPAWLALPLFVIALLMALRAADSLTHPGDALDLHAPTRFNLALLWLTLITLLLQNATLAFLVLMRLIHRIERLLERDSLTDTLNRRAFDQALAQAHAWFRRGRGYALVMIDMDHFKQLNDTLGHAAGDAALRQMVRELQPCVRDVDRFGRLGGEEFCVLLPDTDIAGAALVAERMRALVQATPLRWLEQDWPLSASFGLAEAERGGASASTVLARADAALYRAKGQGRNVVQA